MKEILDETIVKIENIVLPVLKEMELELVDVEYLQEGGYWYVRIYIEKLDGDVSLDDCAEVSMKVEDDIDRLIDKKFFLEISSPGVERPLKKEKDFVRFIGSKVKVSLKHKIDEKKNFEGILSKFENDTLFLSVDDTELEIPFKEVRKANLVYDFKDI
ncbi:ribosome maturation factor RimP [Fusobacterium sp.]|uniref:ribosome maturation factor RimP n=1 Tax=Fusobacterium sp. TaxID=68766 RepID=UPI002615F476|nr:ribosome maturation factor RimP [Fusobacterium sp.]